ncbi:MAG: hypothetical protein C0412_19555, partial [Flavobacterium sp.]|nr:hypothetical protein [Flavobacterium sp.]
LFGKASYKNVVVNGMVLAEDGKKISKSLNNYPDPMDIVSTYSADALRYYLLSSPVMKAEDLKFSTKNVDEVLKKIIMRLQNVYTFFEMYTRDADNADGNATRINADNSRLGTSNFKLQTSNNVLDKWILARLKETATQITKATDNYELDKATRPINDFIEDLSTWFLRRSRDRFKSEDVKDADTTDENITRMNADNTKDRYSAIQTTRTVILEFSKLLAPSMPFLAEDLYLKITGGMEKESVHLENWTEEFVGELSKDEAEIIEKMKETRLIVSLGLEARAKAGIKVRQPLGNLKIKNQKSKLNKQYTDLIKDEVNVKDVTFEPALIGDVELDIILTKELKEEGIMRDIIRTIQEMRKNKKLNPVDLADLVIDTDMKGKNFFEKFNDEISKATGLKETSFEKMEEGELIELDGLKARLLLE